MAVGSGVAAVVGICYLFCMRQAWLRHWLYSISGGWHPARFLAGFPVLFARVAVGQNRQ
jgi:hypothetical protein